MKFFKLIILNLIVLTFTACNSNSKAQIVEKENYNGKLEKKETDKKLIYTENNSVVGQVFKDSAKIGPEKKYMIVIIGTNTDPYTNKLKEDIKNSEQLRKKLKEDFSSYYLKAHENLRHKLYHEGQYMDVDTKTMLSIYQINSTPTLIFSDRKGKAIIIVPGYMPLNQFLVTVNFIESKEWKGKNRKNGEVYESLREFYIKNKINVSKKKD